LAGLAILVWLRAPAMSGVGRVLAIDRAAGTVLLDYAASAEPTTSRRQRFSVSATTLLDPITPGTTIAVTLDPVAQEPTIARVSRLATNPMAVRARATLRSSGHHHRPHHGGVVGMADDYHVEALALSDGRILAYLSDMDRRPLALDEVIGTVKISASHSSPPLPLVKVETSSGAALEARAPALDPAAVTADFSIMWHGKFIGIEFVLPVVPPQVLGAGLPERCDAVPGVAGVPGPRCVLAFGSPVSAIASAHDGRYFAVAALDRPITTWRSDDGELLTAFMPSPQSQQVGHHHDGAVVIRALGMRPGDNELMVGIDNRLLVYATGNGELVEELPRLDGSVLEARWLPGGREIVAITAYQRSLARVACGGTTATERYVVGANAASRAVASDGRTVLVGTEHGRIALVNLADGSRRTIDTESTSRVRGVVLAGRQIISCAGKDALEVRDLETGEIRATLDELTGVTQLALSPSADRLAATTLDGTIHVLALPSLVRETVIDWHRVPVHALAWAGHTLLVGDELGRVALWPLAPAGPNATSEGARRPG
jgi:hypothetical protein